ncbi:hypothetical protein [Massilia consociata]|uniref:hypothetical protein n=1 Tax=Massilia consociata TaxID=760117 RepID=UPI0036D2F480
MKHTINFLSILPHAPKSHDRTQSKRNAYFFRRCFVATFGQADWADIDNAGIVRPKKRNCAGDKWPMVESSVAIKGSPEDPPAAASSVCDARDGFWSFLHNH